MQTFCTPHTLFIPLDFALSQIKSLDTVATLRKLKALHFDLIERTLENTGQLGIQITDNIYVQLSDLYELFGGEHGDIVTAQGMKLLKRMYEECYLEFKYPPTPFPDSLNEYINTCLQTQDIDSEDNPPRSKYITDLKEEAFTYSKLYYLFDALIGTKQGSASLQLAGKTVTRSTIRKETECAEFETVFLWENEACRTQYLKRGG
jgi:hypothetical protein